MYSSASVQRIILQALGRSIVIPQFYGGMDRWWAPHDGTIPGSATRLPYLAPIDHFLDLENGLRNMDEKHFGRNIPVKEYSFLDNPRCPAQIKESRLNVQLCEADSTDPECGDGNTPLKLLDNDTVKILPNRNDVQIQTAFRDLNAKYAYPQPSVCYVAYTPIHPDFFLSYIFFFPPLLSKYPI